MFKVVGWGKDNVAGKMSPIPRIMQLPLVSTEECIRSHSQFYYLTSNTTLCAGAKNGKLCSWLLLVVKDKN